MNKHLIILSMAFIFAQSQRPPFAGSSNRLPAVLPQYLPQDQQQQTQTPSSVINPSSFDNRINNDNTQFSGTPTQGQSTYNYLPVDAHGDIELIKRIESWPKEKQPFWYLNWKQIEAHRGGSGSGSPSNTLSATSNVPTFITRQIVPSKQRRYFTNQYN